MKAKVILHALDPTGVSVKEREFDYSDFPVQETKTWKDEYTQSVYRYYLHVGEYVYRIDRNGKIINTVVEPEVKS